MTTTRNKHVVMGEIASTLRCLVGGRDFVLGFERPPCRISEVDGLSIELRYLLDEYDRMVMEETE